MDAKFKLQFLFIFIFFFTGSNNSITTTDITVAAMQRSPELQVLNRALARSWSAQRACDVLEVSKLIFHLSTQHGS